MKKLILTKYKINSNELAFTKEPQILKKTEKRLFCNTYDFNDFFNPFKVLKNEIELENILVLEVKGKTYTEKMESLRQLAIDFQDFNSWVCDVDFSWSEISNICEWFEKKAKRFGLTKEFKNEGII